MAQSAPINPQAVEALTSAIYDAALDPVHWPQVLTHLKACFRTEAETFYVLDFHTSRVKQAHLSGIAPEWLACFDELYFTPDNPWTVHSQALHRPGVVRTNERLDRFTRERGLLFRSRYYNEWMRPQGLRHSLGNTLTTDRRGIANVTLLRAPDLPTFDAREVRLFAQLGAHFGRALRLRQRFGDLQLQRDLLAGALDRLSEGLLILSPEGRLLHGNLAAMTLLARREGLAYRQGRVFAAHPQDQAAFARLLAARTGHAPQATVSDVLALHRSGGGQPLRVHATGLGLPLSSDGQLQPCVLLSLGEVGDDEAPSRHEALRRAHGLTPAEARLAECLLDGLSLRESAQRLDLTYGTARTRLKVVFAKTGTHRQAELLTQLRLALEAPLRHA